MRYAIGAGGSSGKGRPMRASDAEALATLLLYSTVLAICIIAVYEEWRK